VVAGINYRDLETWQKAMDMVQEVYEATRDFPKEEIYGLRSQIRRAEVSIPSNIAEGQGRESVKDFLRHLSMAYGSLCEAETQIVIAGRLGYIKENASEKIMLRAGEVGRLINGLTRSRSKQIINTQQPVVDNR
jgi:four helix bundle protein